MASFGRFSKLKLTLLDHDLRRLLEEAIRDVDFTVVWTFRNEVEQNDAVWGGRSKLDWPNSKHNHSPALAFDIVPYPGGYEANYRKFFEMATYVLAAASKRGIRLRWGGHWKNYTGNGEYDRDWAHFERIN